MHNNLIGEFEEHVTARAMWDILRLKYGGTSATRLHGLNIKLDSYKLCLDHTIKQHLKKMSTMIRELLADGNNLTEEYKIQVGIHTLPNS